MRFPLAVVLASLLATLGAFAQAQRANPGTVELQIKLDQTLFLPGEPIEVEVALRNSAGRPLVFSPNDDWLNMNVFSITKQVGEGTKVAQFRPVLVKEAFILENAKAARMRVEISQAFALMIPGRYKLTAAAEYRGMTTPASAEPLILQITEGAKLWEQQFGLRAPETDAPVEMRKYALQRLTNLKDLRLYATISDASEGTIIRQVRLGRSAANDNPQAKLDRLSYLHVLHQTDPRLFAHTVINPQGELLRRETFEAVGGPRPGLRLDADGRVIVTSGVRVARPDDLPALQPAPAPAEPLATP
jgi:hypothetical protein